MDVKVFSQTVQKCSDTLIEEVMNYIRATASVKSGSIYSLIELHDVTVSHSRYFSDFRIELMINAGENHILDFLIEKDIVSQQFTCRGIIIPKETTKRASFWSEYILPEDLKQRVLDAFSESILYTKLLKGDI